jgi:hypothetical protein
MARTCLAIVLATLLLPSAVLAASDAPRLPPAADPATEAPYDDPETARMAATLGSQVGHAQLWYWGWAGFYGAVIVGQTVSIAISNSNGTRENAQVNVVSSTFGLFSTLFFPPPVIYQYGPIAAMPTRTPEERAARSAAIRSLFAREASKERFYRSPWNHALGLAVNAAVSAYIYWGLHLGGRALLNLAAGSAIWEANVWTSPNASAELSYALEGKTPVHVQVVPIGLPSGGAGVAVVGSF